MRKKMKKIATIQHPMWLIIKEDTLCAESVPPWGAECLNDYAERVSRNLSIIEKNPDIKLNFDFGAYELEDLSVGYPELCKRMKKMLEAGQLFFVNGSYNQPHGHVLSLETNIRQLEYGLKVFRKLYGFNVVTHAVQEPDYTSQTPQLLKAFGMKFAWYGAFIHDLITPMGKGPQPSLLYRWIGLDGSYIPLIIGAGPGINLDRREPKELQQHEDFLFIKSPDMDEFDIEPDCHYVALDEALEKQYVNCPPEVEAKLQLPWSYVEGTDGESLIKDIYQCEKVLIQLETLLSLMNEDLSAEMLRPLWKHLLQAQHHDALWHGAPELREKSRKWCQETEKKAREELMKIMGDDRKEGSDTLKLTTIYPISHQGILKIWYPGKAPEKLVGVNKEIHIQVDRADNKGVDLLIPYSADGCVQETFSVKGVGKEQDKEIITKGFTYFNDFYRADVSTYGGIVRAYSSEGNPVFLNTASNIKDYTVEGLRKQDAMGIKQKRLIGLGWTTFDETHYLYGIDAAGAITAMIDGKLYAYALSDYQSELIRGPVADILISRGSVGPIPVTRKTYLYHNLPWLEMEISCDFDKTEIDSYSEDSHKLCIWWPNWYKNLITNGIPGGSEVPSRSEIAFLPVSWFDMDTPSGGGLSIAYDATYKTFRRDNRIGTVLAWGDNKGHFSNHDEAMKWRALLDLRLNGRRTYSFFLFPHANNWRDDLVPSWAMARQRPPIVRWESKSPVERRSLLYVQAEGIVPTSIRREETLKIRFYEAYGRDARIDKIFFRGKEVDAAVKGLDGKPMDRITKFKIGEIGI